MNAEFLERWKKNNFVVDKLKIEYKLVSKPLPEKESQWLKK